MMVVERADVLFRSKTQAFSESSIGTQPITACLHNPAALATGTLRVYKLMSSQSTAMLINMGMLHAQLVNLECASCGAQFATPCNTWVEPGSFGCSDSCNKKRMRQTTEVGRHYNYGAGVVEK
jgi:hypothetical protein